MNNQTPDQLTARPIEIFCGTGGVGKTTLSTSRALQLAVEGKKVLLITIDPAKRLKDLLQLKDDNTGKIESIPVSLFHPDETSSKSFDALLMSPAATMVRMAKKNEAMEDVKNPIIEILTRPYGGMNEIMSIIEVEHYIESKAYDTIVLDTPPGKHFIDFLSSARKISQFFDNSFVDIFRYLGKKIEASESATTYRKKVFDLVVKSGIKKLLGYLNQVTGPTFVDDFVDAILTIYANKNSFLKALEFQQNIQQNNFANWFLVTSPEQYKIEDLKELKESMDEFVSGSKFILLNKSMPESLKNSPQTPIPFIENLISSIKQKEENIIENYKSRGHRVMKFPDIISASPRDHVKALEHYWPTKA